MLVEIWQKMRLWRVDSRARCISWGSLSDSGWRVYLESDVFILNQMVGPWGALGCGPWKPTCSLRSWAGSRQSPPPLQPSERPPALRILSALSPLNCQSAAPADRLLCVSPPRVEKPISVSRLSASEPPPNFPNLFFSPPRDHRTISPADPCRSRSDAAGHSGDSFVRQKSKSDCLCPAWLVPRSTAASHWCGLLSHAAAPYLSIHVL